MIKTESRIIPAQEQRAMGKNAYQPNQSLVLSIIGISWLHGQEILARGHAMREAK
jgi:hypothetical protein